MNTIGQLPPYVLPVQSASVPKPSASKPGQIAHDSPVLPLPILPSRRTFVQFQTLTLARARRLRPAAGYTTTLGRKGAYHLHHFACPHNHEGSCMASLRVALSSIYSQGIRSSDEELNKQPGGKPHWGALHGHFVCHANIKCTLGPARRDLLRHGVRINAGERMA